MSKDPREDWTPADIDRVQRERDAARVAVRGTAQKFIDSLSDPAMHKWCANILFAKLTEERGLMFAGNPLSIQPKVAELCEILEAYYKRELENSDL